MILPMPDAEEPEEQCSSVMDGRAMKISVNTIIRDAKGRYLLQMRDGNPGICHPLMWNFFGGRLEADESPIEGAIREMLEEIGHKSERTALEEIGVQEDGVQRVYVVRMITTIEQRQIVLGEGAGFGYFSIDDMQRIDITPMTRAIIQRHDWF
jgi:8-oxo-dGTP diphosphatase